MSVQCDDEEPVTSTGAFFRFMSMPIAAIMLTAIAMWHVDLSTRHPFNFMPDMDLLAVTESLNMNSGRAPYFIAHPGYGMYLYHVAVHRTAASLGIVDVLTLEELDASVSPLTVIAELTRFLRLHTSIIVVLTAGALSAALSGLLRLPAWLGIGVFLMFGTLPAFAFQSQFIRVEMFSVFYVAIGIAMGALWNQSRGKRIASIYLAAAGFFLSMGFLTKYQSIFLITIVLALFVVVYWAGERESPETGSLSYENRAKLVTYTVGILGPSILIAIIFRAAYAPDGEAFLWYYETLNTPDYHGSLSLLGFGFVAIAVLFILAHTAHASVARHHIRSLRILLAIDVLLLGALLALLSPLVLYAHPAPAWQLLMANTRAVFFEVLAFSKTRHFDIQVGTLVEIFSSLPFSFLILVFAGMWFGWLIAARRSELPMWLLLVPACVFAVILAAIMLGIRPFFRDVVWINLYTLLPSIFFLGLGVRVDSARRRSHLAATSVVVGIVLLTNLVQLPALTSETFANTIQAGRRPGMFIETWFASPEFNRIMTERYPERQRPVAFEAALDYPRNERALETIFTNLNVGSDCVGIAKTGWPVWYGHPEWRLQTVPKPIAGAMVFDPTELTPSRRYYFDSLRYVPADTPKSLFHSRSGPSSVAESESQSTRATKVLSVLPRWDYDVRLYASVEDLKRIEESLSGEGVRRPWTPAPVTLRNGDAALTLRPIVIDRYAEIDTALLRSPYFFTIKLVYREQW